MVLIQWKRAAAVLNLPGEVYSLWEVVRWFTEWFDGCDLTSCLHYPGGGSRAAVASDNFSHVLNDFGFVLNDLSLVLNDFSLVLNEFSLVLNDFSLVPNL